MPKLIKSLFFLLCISIFVGNVQAENTFVKGAAKFLPADEAFKLVKAEFDGEKNLRITLDIAEGYYLYKSKFEIISTQPLAYEINYPSGTIKEDEYFGKQEVFYGGIVLSAKFRKKPDGIAQASLKFQGCSDSGLCYPPTTIPLTIKLNKGSNNHDISEISSIKNKMLNDNLVLVILGFLVSGILLSVTPCVLPMVPILSGIIISSGKRKARSLTFAYVLGVCFTYTSLGVFAGFTGTLLSSSIQNTNFLYFSSAMFLLFALMMLDVIRINIPLGTNNTISSFTERFMGGGITSVFLMGLFSALILSPCVAPPLAAAILFIGQSGDVFVGGLSLLFLALGMSLPLLLIGFTSKSFLPKPGLWMDYIKKIIGFILLAMSAYILRPLMHKRS
jgi:thioredoxin:protein disulfide reductase